MQKVQSRHGRAQALDRILPTDHHDGGLCEDLPRLLPAVHDRRMLLAWMAAGCTGILLGGRAGATVCLQPGVETAGPFPADGSNSRNGTRINVLEQSGVVRSDLTRSFGGATGVADGVALDLTIRLVNTTGDCAPLANYVVYLWSCTRDGRYSLYSRGVTGENFLRGIQAANDDGELAFRTIFPGCYPGRYPHLHFEVYAGLDLASDFRQRVLTSQIVMPAGACHEVYATDAYADSAPAFERTSLGNDGVFRDNTPEELAAATPDLAGDPARGYAATFQLGIAAA